MFDGVGYFPAMERDAKNLTGLQEELLPDFLPAVPNRQE
jgi:hypothetical protein